MPVRLSGLGSSVLEWWIQWWWFRIRATNCAFRDGFFFFADDDFRRLVMICGDDRYFWIKILSVWGLPCRLKIGWFICYVVLILVAIELLKSSSFLVAFDFFFACLLIDVCLDFGKGCNRLGTQWASILVGSCLHSLFSERFIGASDIFLSNFSRLIPNVGNLGVDLSMLFPYYEAVKVTILIA